eukprot:PLAT5692.2.p1 GENE.PLAT5692.2~~PLAT5692.2.p1  ORF type:complete len:796 (-),score=413.96 PLAT5692.2:54-2441(-)
MLRRVVGDSAAARSRLLAGLLPAKRAASSAATDDGAAASLQGGSGGGAGGTQPHSGVAAAAGVELEGVTIVRDAASAAKALAVLESLRGRFHACDTETTDLDIKKVGPVGNGRVICASIYSGDDVDFGSGPRLWIDNLDDAQGTLALFQPFFSDPEQKLVWHNYGFDRHVLYNEGIDARGLGADTMHMARLWDASRTAGGGYSLESLTTELLGAPKRNMKDRFGRPRILKDGSEGKTIDVPDPVDLQRSAADVADWIDYSTYDAEGTWRLRDELQRRLQRMPWTADGSRTMYDYYTTYLVPFGELLTDMEREGVYVDVEKHLPRVQAEAEADRAAAQATFVAWASLQCEDAAFMNPGSSAQKQQLLFAPARNRKTKEAMPLSRTFKTENTTGYIEPGKKAAKKYRDIVISGIGLPPSKYTAAGLPAVSLDVLRDLAGSPDEQPPRYGTAYDHLGGGLAGKQACEAIDALCRMSSIDTLLSNFIIPLQGFADAGGRVHCSLNLNTETGRLSSRRPNLQNQPALEKDRYKIRDAFCAEEGNALIVADYGQLELRLLAHMTECRSMIDAFAAGGDFHSRTAMGMYPYIQEAVQAGEVLLEWDGDGDSLPPVPLLKDRYASERRKAKVLNFSIAYGKTARGLSADFGVSVEEAKATLERWYADRPEVRSWQQATIENARQTGYTRTLMGRYRPLREINDRHPGKRGHCERAAINTPIQGGAADVVMKAMLNIHSNERLRAMGWRLLLQIHDEVILEGPQESADEALAMVKYDMEHPFRHPLLVDMAVDGKWAQTWYEAK